MNYNDDVTITMELDERFDELFAETDVQEESPKRDSYIGLQDSPIKDLKVAVLSLDWEMTDQIMDRFNMEIEKLKEIWAEDKTLLMFLQLLNGIGKYIRKKRDKAHPGSIGLLHSTYSSLEKVVLTDGISEEEKQRIFNFELTKFNELKKQIAVEKKVSPQKMEPPLGQAMEIDTPTETTMIADIDEDITVDSPDSEINDLKHIVQALDLEITDQVMDSFDEERNRLRTEQKDDGIVLLFLQLLGGIGKYIRVKRGKSHPGSMALLHSACDGLEKVISSQGMSEAEKKEVFQAELEKFNELKKEIAEERAPVRQEEKETPVEEITPQKIGEETTVQIKDIEDSVTTDHLFTQDDMVEQEERIDSQDVFPEDQYAIHETTTQEIPPETNIIEQEEEIEILETSIDEEYAAPDIMISDTETEDEIFGEKDEISIQEETMIEDSDSPSLLVPEVSAEDEEISPVKKKRKRKFWFFGRGKKDKEALAEGDIAQELDIHREEGELEFHEVDEAEEGTTAMETRDIFTQDEMLSEVDEINMQETLQEEEQSIPEITPNDLFTQNDALPENNEMDMQGILQEEEQSTPEITPNDLFTQNDTLHEDNEMDMQEILQEEEQSIPEITANDLFTQNDAIPENDEAAMQETLDEEGFTDVQRATTDMSLQDHSEWQEEEVDLQELTVQEENVGFDAIPTPVFTQGHMADGEAAIDRPESDISEHYFTPEMKSEEESQPEDTQEKEMTLSDMVVQEDRVNTEMLDFNGHVNNDELVHGEGSGVIQGSNDEEIAIHETTATDTSDELEKKYDESLELSSPYDNIQHHAGGADMYTHEAFIHALEEINNTIKSEFSSLRAELRMWREDRQKGTE